MKLEYEKLKQEYNNVQVGTELVIDLGMTSFDHVAVYVAIRLRNTNWKPI